MSEHEDEPEDQPTPPESTPPTVPDSPIVSPVPEINQLVEGFRTALAPTFKQIEESITRQERRSEEQQKQLEDLARNMNKTVEDKIIQVMKAVAPPVQARDPSVGQYVSPQQTAQYAPQPVQPVQPGIKGFVGQIMQFLMSPDGRSLMGQSGLFGGTNPGLITIDTNAIFEGGIQKAVRDVATRSLRVAFSGLEDRLNPIGTSVLDHTVVPDHV